MLSFKKLVSAFLAVAALALPGHSLAQGTQFPAGTVWGNDTATQRPGKLVTVPSCANDGAHALVYISGSGFACANNSATWPQGRLTLTSGVAQMTSSVTGATIVYFTPSGGSRTVPITADGVNFVNRTFAEMSQALTDATKSPAAATTNSNYDLFAWDDTGTGTLRTTRGPPWASDTSRGTGAGTTELDFTTSFPTNKVAITNGPAANRGTWVGTIRTNGTSTVDYTFGSVAANWGTARFGVWNAYNRLPVYSFMGDNTDSWTYNVATTWRAANGNANARIFAVRGLDVDLINARNYGRALAGASTGAVIGIGVNSTTAFSGSSQLTFLTSDFNLLVAEYSGLMGIGWVFLAPIELNTTTTNSIWAGDSGLNYFQTGMHVTLWQ